GVGEHRATASPSRRIVTSEPPHGGAITGVAVPKDIAGILQVDPGTVLPVEATINCTAPEQREAYSSQNNGQNKEDLEPKVFELVGSQIDPAFAVTDDNRVGMPVGVESSSGETHVFQGQTFKDQHLAPQA